MTIRKLVRNIVVIATFSLSAAFISGCGGVDEAQMAELQNLRSEVNALETEANNLKQERSNLERDIAEKNAKLQQCAKDKEQTRANLQKLPQ
jgi:septal ring factor EnvC (AmiA/AmiB activator)